MFTREAARSLYARLFASMSMEDARAVLGLPAYGTPSAADVKKALRKKTFEHHPDRGGDPRKQVELNVAADILLGKQRPDHRAPSGPTVDPEAERRRQEEERRRQEALQLKKDLEHLEDAKEAAVKAMDRAKANVAFQPAGLLDLRGYLMAKFADKLDELEDAAEDALKAGGLDPKDERVWKQVDRLAEQVLARGLRMATKLKAARKVFLKLNKSNAVSVSIIRAAQVKQQAFWDGFHQFRNSFDKLMTILNTTETVPYDLVESVGDAFTMVSSFDETFQRSGSDESYERAVKSAVQGTAEIIIRQGLSFKRKWEDWLVGVDFEKIIDALHKVAGHRNRNASKVASPDDLGVELSRLLADSQSQQVSRAWVAAELRSMADRL